MASLYYNPNTGKQVSSRAVAREEKAARKTARKRSSPGYTRPRAAPSPSYGPTPKRARAEQRERRTGVVITPSARRYVGSPAQARDIREGRMPTRAVTPVVQRAVARARRPAAPARETQPGAEEFFGEARLPKSHPGQDVPATSAAGLDWSGLRGLRGSSSLSDILGNTGRGLLDIVTGAPAVAQLGIENVAAFNPVGGALYGQHLLGGPAIPGITGYQERVAGIDVEAAKGVAADYSYRYGPFFEGNWREGGRRVEENPVPYALDLAAGKAAVARAPTGALRAARVVAPRATRAGITRRLSGYNAQERAAIARGLGQTDVGAGGTFLPGPGGLHRPPRRRMVSPVEVTEEGRRALPATERVIPQRPYSRDIVNRTIQKRIDRRRARQGPGPSPAEARAQVRLPIPGRKPEGKLQGARAARERQGVLPRSVQGKEVKRQKAETLTLKDLYQAKGEAAFAKVSPGAVRAINRLRGTKGPAGLNVRGRTSAREVASGRSIEPTGILSVEEAAARLHLDDVLPEPGKLRGGKSAPEIRDLWVRGVEGRQKTVRARKERTDLARQQVQAVREIPNDLLYLTGDSAAVRRVRAAVQEGRKLDRKSQAMSVAAKVVSRETVREAATRPSALTVGGSRYWKEAARATAGKRTRKTRAGARIPTTRYAARLRAIDKRIAAAAPRSPERAALRAQRATVVRAQKGRVAHVKEQATRKTPELVAQREKVAQARRKVAEREATAKARATRAAGAQRHKVSPRTRPVAGGAVAERVVERKFRVVQDAAGWKIVDDAGYQVARHGSRAQAIADLPRVRKYQGQRVERAKPAPEMRARPRPEPTPVRARTKEVTAARQALDRHVAHLKKMEDDLRGFTPARRPELVGKKGVYIPARPVDPELAGYPGPPRGGRFSGVDVAKREKGVYRSSGRNDMNPALLVHQARRSTQNYTGTISTRALDELIASAAYRTADGKLLTAEKLTGRRQVDPARVRWLHRGNLEKALRKLDDLEPGKWLPEREAREVISDQLPEGGRKSDYVAISKDAADVWTQAMTRIPVLDTLLNYWKGGLLALSPRWYVNNTVGLALQYVLLTGGDFKAVFAANRMSKPIRAAITKRAPAAVKDTMVDDLVGGATLPKMLTAGFKFNNRLEEFWRRSAFYSRAKRELRTEGGRLRDMTDAQVAKFIETMPEPMARAIVRDLDFFIGNYRKFNKFEQNVMKRVLPFYSWLRVIARLTFALPFRSPTRLAIAGVLANAQEAGLNPLDPALDYWERGALSFGDVKVPTWSLNPWQSLAGVINAVGDQNPLAKAIEDGMGWMHPLFQYAYAQASGETGFGTGITAPPGVKPFGKEGPLVYNRASRQWERQKVRVPALEAILSSAAPGQVSVLRSYFAENRTPYGTVTTTQLFQDWWDRQTGGKGNDKLYFDKGERRGREPTSLNRVSKVFGAPTYRQDDARVIREAREKARDAAKEQRSLARAARG